MSFNDNARLDTSQVESGGRGGGAPGGLVVGGGVGGIVLLVIALLFGINPSDLPTSGTGTDPGQVSAGGTPDASIDQCRSGADANRDDTCLVVATVNSVQDYWGSLFEANGRSYQPSKTVIYSGSTRSACGTASNQVGPFYCPLDTEGLPRRELLRAAADPVRLGHRPAREGVRRRPRVRPPHPGRAGPARPGPAGPAGTAERCRARRAHGRLPRRGVGQPCERDDRRRGNGPPPGHHRAGPRLGPVGGEGRRGRPHPGDDGWRRRQPRELDARLERGASAVVPPGLPDRLGQPVQHLRGRHGRAARGLSAGPRW